MPEIRSVVNRGFGLWHKIEQLIPHILIKKHLGVLKIVAEMVELLHRLILVLNFSDSNFTTCISINL